VAVLFATLNIKKFKPANRDLSFLGLVTLGGLAGISLYIPVVEAVEGHFHSLHPEAFRYAIPVASAAMLVRFMLNSETALVFISVSTLLLGFALGGDFRYLIYAAVSSIAGAHAVGYASQRFDLIKAGVKVGLVNVAMAAGLKAFDGGGAGIADLYAVAAAFLGGGLLSGIMVTGIAPLVEFVFGYATDVKLMELAKLDHPVLRQLVLSSPGSYQHAMVVGTLAENAAEEIGANPVIARVSAYYHDIGKSRMPLYFIENQGTEENPHDRLTPHMSALVIISHVKEGVEIAQKHRLPEVIVDTIAQHHGTSLIKYFHEKAKSREVPDGTVINEVDFRYPGPKPQTKEAGIVMLADAVEAASKVLQDPTPARIQGMVQKIIKDIFADGQLDNCMLTLKDMNGMAMSFIRVLTAAKHHRIDYPEPVFAGGQDKRKQDGDSDQRSTGRETDKPKDGKKDGGDNLRRLGITRR
jgi:putative nucleotidyltransferase with HDIG domain